MRVRALVTGAAGFCGRHLIARLAAEGGFVTAGVDRSDAPPRNLRLDEYYGADVGDAERIADVIACFRPDMLFHLAGIGGGSSPAARDSSSVATYKTNFMGAVHVLDGVYRRARECRVLLAGSAAEYGPVSPDNLPVTEDCPCQPSGPYGSAKYAATLAGLDYARRFGLKVVVARPFNIVGPGIPPGMVLGALLIRAREALAAPGDPVVWMGDLDSERDFVAVDDVMAAYLELLRGNFWGEVFNICSGTPHSIRAVAEILLANSPRPIRIQVDPSLASGSVRRIYGSCEKAKRAFNYRPLTGLEQTLNQTWAYSLQ